ncbi:unnamed protein product [Orchesella dallaii]|uniref:Carbonic anhydrase n=1 Tax=Orchesella dallaii TaxID=48710 RepID=A0ABP1REL3_9HEXA
MWKHSLQFLSTQKLQIHTATTIISISLILFSSAVVLVNGAGSDANWCYDSLSCGPETWGGTCLTGKLQSPINLELSSVKKVAKSVNLVLSREYGTLNSFFLQNNGFSVSLLLNPDETSPCLVRGTGFLPNEPYYFSSFHFHWGPDDYTGSEHQINGRKFPLELHMIHRQVGDPNKLAVFGILYKISETDNPTLAPIVDNLILVQNATDLLTLIPVPAAVKLVDFLPKKVRVLRYQGSLTTPPCTEGVVWTVFDDIQTISARQLMKFRSLLKKDTRPIRNNFRPVVPTYTEQRKSVLYMKSIVPSLSSVKRNG